MSEEKIEEKIEETITINDVPHKISELSDAARNLISLYNRWAVKEAGLRDEMMMFQAAKQTLSSQIINKINEDKAETDGSVDNSDKKDIKTTEY